MNEKNQLPSNIDIINVLKNSNLTPSQKVSVITEINNKNQPSKNLSHVPCKFFKQGACQAGNSCPFSHATDIQLDSQPCKYFQKGNCRFGIKCALAHVLPDGRKVNTKILQNYPKFPNNNNNNNNSNNVEAININDTKSNDFNHFYQNSNTPYNISPSQNHYTYNPSTTQSFSTSSPPQLSSFTVASTAPEFFDSANLATSPFKNNSIWSNNTNSSFTNNDNISNNVMSMSVNDINNLNMKNNNQHFIRSVSFSNTSNVNMKSSSNNNHFNSPNQQHHFLSNASPNASYFERHYSADINKAIIDSEDEGEEENRNENENRNRNDENDDTEDVDYIPSSLNDLLTPQELKRRKSRPSFNNPLPVFTNLQHGIDDETPFVME